MSFALCKMILIKMKVQMFLLMKICSQFTLQGVSLPSMSRNFFEHATKKPTPPAASSGTRSIFWTCFFIISPRDGLKGKSEETTIAWPENAESKRLRDPLNSDRNNAKKKKRTTQPKTHDLTENARPSRKRANFLCLKSI